MNNIKDDGYYLQKIRKDLNFINEVLQDSMMFRLIQVSENARKLTDAFKEEHNQVPWGDVYGLRNRIVHDYGMVDLHVVYVTLIKDVPELMNSLGE